MIITKLWDKFLTTFNITPAVHRDKRQVAVDANIAALRGLFPNVPEALLKDGHVANSAGDLTILVPGNLTLITKGRLVMNSAFDEYDPDLDIPKSIFMNTKLDEHGVPIKEPIPVRKRPDTRMAEMSQKAYAYKPKRGPYRPQTKSRSFGCSGDCGGCGHHH